MFVDACAIVSVLSGEPDAEAFGVALAGAKAPVTSPLAAWEAIMVLSRPEKFGIAPGRCRALVLAWLAERRIALRHPQASPEEVLTLAVEIAEKFGVGRTRLSSLGCFHYAQARADGDTLLTSDRLQTGAGWRTAP